MGDDWQRVVKAVECRLTFLSKVGRFHFIRGQMHVDMQLIVNLDHYKLVEVWEM